MLLDIFSLSLRSISAMKAPIGLAIHTSSPDLGLAIGELDEIRQEVWDLGRDMTTYLHEKLAQFIKPQSFQDLAFIAVAQGPGSFTGTRMGMTVARTLAQQLSIPLFGVSSLAAIAATQAPLHPIPTIAVKLAAQRGELHVGIYKDPFDWTKNCDRVLLAQTWQDEWQALNPEQRTIVVEAPVHQGEFVQAVLKIAHHAYGTQSRPSWWQVTPTYGQHPVTH